LLLFGWRSGTVLHLVVFGFLTTIIASCAIWSFAITCTRTRCARARRFQLPRVQDLFLSRSMYCTISHIPEEGKADDLLSSMMPSELLVVAGGALCSRMLILLLLLDLVPS